MDYGIDFNSIEESSIIFSGDKDNLTLLIQELEKFHRTISTFGFSQQELESVKNNFKGQFHLFTTNWENATTNIIANQIVKELMQTSMFLSPKQHEKHLIEILPYITPEYCLSLWEDLWKDGAFLFVSGPFDQTITADSIRKTFLESQKTVLKIPEVLKKHEFLSPFNQEYSSKIIDRDYHKALGIETLCLSNQVRINLKQTDFEKDRIFIHVGIGSGMLSLKNCPYPGIQLLLSSSFVDGGLKQCDRNTLDRIFDGKLINLDFDVDEECYAFKCVTNRENLLEQLQLIGAYMIEPAYRTEGLENFKKNIPAWYEYFDKTPKGVLMSKIPTFLTCNDDRFGYPEQSILLQRNFDEAKKILTPVFNQQYIEVSIVGDFERIKLIDNLLSTFGKLNMRDAQKIIDDSEKILSWPQAQTKIFTCKTQLDKAILYIVWPTKAPQDADDIRRFTVLSSILENRLLQEIRQILGDTYSPKVDQHQSINFKGKGSINAILTVAPTKLDFIAEKTMTIANDIAEKGITQDELNRAVKPIITDLKKQIVTNKFWISWLSNWQSLPKKSELDLNNVEAYEKISKEAIDEFAKIYLKRSSAICIQIKPELSQQ